jgi:hypothetical protein
MNRKDYFDKMRKWETEGYDVSSLKEKWFPRKGKGSTVWVLGIVVVFISVAGIVIWQLSKPPSPSTPYVASTVTTSLESTPAVSLSAQSSLTTMVSSLTSPQVLIVRYSLATSVNPTNAGIINPNSGTFENGASITLCCAHKGL